MRQLLITSLLTTLFLLTGVTSAHYSGYHEKSVKARKLCPGDGASGPRVHVYYAYDPRKGSELTRKMKWQIRRILGRAQKLLSHSDPRYHVKVNYLCWNDRWMKVTPAPVLKSGEFVPTISEMKDLGYDRRDRIYLFFVQGTHADTRGYSGYARPNGAINPSPDPYNHQGPAYAWSFRWTQRTALHELLHTLGAVDNSAPHSSGNLHCYDEHDVLCYMDGGPYFKNGGHSTYTCVGIRVDCNRDDYYDPAPTARTEYLRNHWNVADSLFVTERRLRWKWRTNRN